MKLVLNILAATLIATSAFAADIAGNWKTERPTSINPYAMAIGHVTFDAETITYRSECIYDRGPVVEASVVADVEYKETSFNILKTVRNETRDNGYACSAYLTEGRVSYRLREDGRLVLFNPRYNWRMVLIKE
jgi:hypothetical protein